LLSVILETTKAMFGFLLTDEDRREKPLTNGAQQ
jgi:hypothetical protein